MTAEDRVHWDARWRDAGDAPIAPPAQLAGYAARFPSTGRALDVACGTGTTSIWLARRGLAVTGIDVSPVAIDIATRRAESHGVDERCRFVVHDLDDGLPPGQPVDLVVCHLFNDRRLDGALVERLAPGGLLAMAILTRGRFGAQAHELLDAFAGRTGIDVLDHEHDERAGCARLLVLKAPSAPTD